MSYSTSRARALDATQPLPHRASSARSCAVLVAEKYGVARSVVIARVQAATGVDLIAPASGADIEAAIACLDGLRVSGLGGDASA